MLILRQTQRHPISIKAPHTANPKSVRGHAPLAKWNIRSVASRPKAPRWHRRQSKPALLTTLSRLTCAIVLFWVDSRALASHWTAPRPFGSTSSSAAPQDDKTQSDESANNASANDDSSEAEPIPDLGTFTRDFQRNEGFLTYYWNPRTGKIYLQIPNQIGELLYVNSLATGLGSNPVGLDRGQLGSQRVVHFRRIGPKVLMIQRNLRFRARSEREAERRAVAESFAPSVLWGGDVCAQDDDSVLVDLTPLLTTDMHDVAGKLKRSGQGDFALASDRSALYLPRCKAFPDNVEFEAMLTFTSREPGPRVNQTAATPTDVSFRQHHSFVRLPDEGYRPREYNVRAPSMSITFADYSAPIDAPLEVRWILRHRLRKKNPADEVSEPVQPIVYYVDRGAPSPIREALIEGASWWNQAFEAAGFRDAFRVELLPEDADPMDVRYNVIQWVHRRTRGWSYGGSVIDPRTGEILKGHVTLGSLRVRQDHLIITGLTSGKPDDLGGCGIVGVASEDVLARLAGGVDGGELAVEVALARIRQLAAHEVGHTLGFVHNFAASTYDDRASVMDYPAPRVTIRDGKLDLSDAYAVGMGSWDKFAVRYAYSDFGDAEPGVELSRLREMVDEAYRNGARFVTDADSRPSGAAHPWGNLWDNGQDPLQELDQVMQVRGIALENFDPERLPSFTDSADIEQYLVPLLLHHRYQVQATGKLLGGVYYDYGSVDQTGPVRPVPTAIQQSAMRRLIELLKPETLAVPPALQRRIGVRWFSSQRDVETFPRRTGRVFDGVMAGQIAGELVLDELFQPDRLTRMSQQGPDGPSARQLISELIESVWQRPAGDDPLLRPLSRTIRASVFQRLIKLADESHASPDVRGAALDGLGRFASLSLQDADGWDQAEVDFRLWLQRELNLYQNQARPPRADSNPPQPPPGSPIGG